MRALALALALALAACGPSVAVDHGGDTSSGSSTGSVVTAESTVTDATVTTASTSTSTTIATTSPGDEATSVDPNSEGGDEVVDEGASFIAFPDIVCFASCNIECDIWAQDCPKGDKCMPWANDGGDSWNAVRCSTIDPTPAAIGDPCVAEGSGVSGIDDCGISAMCWGVDPLTLEGECVAMCGGSEANPTCAEGLGCFFSFDGWVTSCVPPCDPLAPSCDVDEACMYTGRDPPYARFVCLPTPPFVASNYGEACELGSLQLCGSGLACALPEHVPGCAGEGCCTSVGELSQMPVCPDASQTCIPFEDTRPVAGPCYCGVSP